LYKRKAACTEVKKNMLVVRIRTSGFRGEDLKKNRQSETRIACGGHVW
jgi:hypothetical protein